jgi:hypothetical protein
VKHVDRQSAPAGKQAGNMGSEFGIEALIGSKQNPFQIGDKAVLLEFLPFQSFLFFL